MCRWYQAAGLMNRFCASLGALLMHALAIAEKTLGPDHPHFGTALNSLALAETLHLQLGSN